MVGKVSCSDRKTQHHSFHQCLLYDVSASFAQISPKALVPFNLSSDALIELAREYFRTHASTNHQHQIRLKFQK
jgi:hypothetical protein